MSKSREFDETQKTAYLRRRQDDGRSDARSSERKALPAGAQKPSFNSRKRWVGRVIGRIVELEAELADIGRYGYGRGRRARDRRDILRDIATEKSRLKPPLGWKGTDKDVNKRNTERRGGY